MTNCVKTSYVRTRFREICEEHLKEYGFQWKKNGCFRVIHDVVQVVSFERIFSGSGLRIYFSIKALCYFQDGNLTDFLTEGCFPLRLFKVPPKKRWIDGIYCSYWRDDNECWMHDPRDQEDCENCLCEISKYMKDYLVPLFLAGDSCKTGFDVLSQFIATSEWADTWKYNTIQYYMALKNRDYTYALEYLESCLSGAYKGFEEEEERYKSNPDDYSTEEKERLRKWRERIQILSHEIELLKNSEYAYFEELVDRNEACFRKALEETKIKIL